MTHENVNSTEIKQESPNAAMSIIDESLSKLFQYVDEVAECRYIVGAMTEIVRRMYDYAEVPKACFRTFNDLDFAFTTLSEQCCERLGNISEQIMQIYTVLRG